VPAPAGSKRLGSPPVPVSWALRLDDLVHRPGAVAFTLEVLAVAISGFAAWLGGDLVDRLGVACTVDTTKRGSVRFINRDI
jgi:hypothetical protein